MRHRQLFSLIAMSFMACSALASIQRGDFRIYEDGETVFIDGSKGGPLHIEYIGSALKAPLKVKVTPDDSGLRVFPASCTFTQARKVCNMSIQLPYNGKKVYGVHPFTIKEEVGNQGAESISTPDTSLVSFEVGILPKDMPKPITWTTKTYNVTSGKPKNHPVILVNATQSNRLYAGHKIHIFRDTTPKDFITTDNISLPPSTLCYLDEPSLPTLASGDGAVVLLSTGFLPGTTANWSSIRDITDPNRIIENGPYATGNNNISTCSANNADGCASAFWGSMSVGLANLGSKDLLNGSDGIRAGEVQVLSDTSWGNASWSNPGSILYWRGSWDGSDVALLFIQGTTDGTGFDVAKAAPSTLKIKAAPPCSTYIGQ